MRRGVAILAGRDSEGDRHHGLPSRGRRAMSDCRQLRDLPGGVGRPLIVSACWATGTSSASIAAALFSLQLPLAAVLSHGNQRSVTPTTRPTEILTQNVPRFGNAVGATRDETLLWQRFPHWHLCKCKRKQHPSMQQQQRQRPWAGRGILQRGRGPPPDGGRPEYKPLLALV